MAARDGSMVAVRKDMVWGDGRISVAPWGGDDFKPLGEMKFGTVDKFCLAEDSTDFAKFQCGELSFEFETKDFDVKKFEEMIFGNVIKSLASKIRKYRTLGYRCFHVDVGNRRFCELKRHAHYFYGCNIKRALRKEGVRGINIRHKTRNGYWVWMK